MFITKKGASEVIVVTLVIVVTVILAIIFFAWFKETSKSNLDQTADEMKQASDLSCMNASIVIESCKFNNNDLNVLLINNSDIKLFNLVISVYGKNTDNKDTSFVGRFEEIVKPGEIKKLSTKTNFTYVTEDGDFNKLEEIERVILTNGACPKYIINLDCEEI